MNEEPGSRAFDLRAVGTGVLWGLAAMLLGAVVQGFVGYGSPFSGRTEDMMTMVWQAAGGLIGGFLSARRASGSGWLHGAAAGLALMLAVLVVNGISTDLPAMSSLLKVLGIATGSGLVGGVAGVNTRRS